MKILITGSSGLLGRSLINSAPMDFQIISISRTSGIYTDMENVKEIDCDLENFDSFIDIYEKELPDFVIHSAADGRVDYTQENFEEVSNLNVVVPGKIAEISREFGSKLIFVSSNAVYGRKPGPYRESSPKSPINKYGELKVEAEKLVAASSGDFLIVRPILMYGNINKSQRKNPVLVWVEKLKKGEQISVVDDVYTEPLFVLDCAQVIWKAIDKEFFGSVNVSGPEYLSLFDFAVKVAETLKLDRDLIEPVKSTSFPTIAPRPTSTSFDKTLINQELGIFPMGIKEGISRMFGIQ